MDEQLQIRSYNPDIPTYAPRIRNEHWDEHQSVLKRLHEEGYKRAAMLDLLREQGFYPSMSQLNAKMTAWGYKVYGSQTDRTSQTNASMSIQDNTPVAEDIEMANPLDDNTIFSFRSDDSTSSRTLVELKDESSEKFSNERLSLDEIIAIEGLNMMGTYCPKVVPLDFGIKSPGSLEEGDDTNVRAILSVANFLRMVHCFEAAFDLYQNTFEQSLTSGCSLIQALINCAMCATTSAQCNYIKPILEKASSHCNELSLYEHGLCCSSLLQDIAGEATSASNQMPKDTKSTGIGGASSFLTASTVVDPSAQQTEEMQQKFLACDNTSSTLSNLVLWCLDALNFYGTNQSIGKHLHKAVDGFAAETTAFEREFQALVSILVIDYLNSPGAEGRKGNVACQDNECPFRQILCPVSSLVTIARVVLAPSRPFAQHGSSYLRSRSRAFLGSRLNLTTASDELKAFLRATEDEKRVTFMDTFLQSSRTSLKFRQLVSGVSCSWDRMLAAKRLARIMLTCSSGLLPHAGLPVLRRFIHKALAAPFEDDIPGDAGRPSVTSASSSVKDFNQLASQLRFKADRLDPKTPSDTMSIDTRSSWSFHHVTGFSRGSVSASNSVSSRRRERDETDEYRNFLKDNNHGQHCLVPQSLPVRPAVDRSKKAELDPV